MDSTELNARQKAILVMLVAVSVLAVVPLFILNARTPSAPGDQVRADLSAIARAEMGDASAADAADEARSRLTQITFDGRVLWTGRATDGSCLAVEPRVDMAPRTVEGLRC